MNRIEILKLKGIDENLFNFYYVTNDGLVISPEFNYDGEIVKEGAVVYQEWLENKDKPQTLEPTTEDKISILKRLKTLEEESASLKNRMNYIEVQAIGGVRCE